MSVERRGLLDRRESSARQITRTTTTMGDYTIRERFRLMFPKEDTAFEKAQTAFAIVWYYVLPGIGLLMLIGLGLVKLWRALL